MHPYDNHFAPDNVYGHALSLLRKTEQPTGGVHLDFGCGYGRIAESLRDELQLHYIGLDVLASGLDSLKSRGFDTMLFDLGDPAASLALVEQWLPQDKPVASVTFLDTLEHLADPGKALQLLRAVATKHGCPLVLSVPNAAHRDIGMKLVVGQFEYTESGLLDHTHYQYFTERSLTDRMRGFGWHEVSRNDVLLEQSDQHFPADHALLSGGTPINGLLHYLRQQIDQTSTVNQFVRMYLPGPIGKPAAVESDPSTEPFLTVVTRTQGERIESLRETLLCLSAQTCQDFDILVVGHKLSLEQQLNVERVIADLHGSVRERVRLVKVGRGERASPLNAGFEDARGRYVAMLDDDDLVFGHWVETFKHLHRNNPGKLLRAVAVSQGWDKIGGSDGSLATRCKSGYKAEYPESFDLFDHLIENRSPLHSLAFPRSLYRDLGFRFDETLTTAEDWDFIIRTAPIAGVACSEEITCVYRRWHNGRTSYNTHDQEEWKANYHHSLRKMDMTSSILPAGYTRRVRELLFEVDRLRQGATQYHAHYAESAQDQSQATYIEALRWRLYELINSKSWRYTNWLRKLKNKLTGNPGLPEMMIWRFNTRDLEYLIAMIEGSKTWKYATLLRALKTTFR
ncbi:MAG: methyltransferase domain-containing protein [Luteimonas sp.]